MGIDPKLVDPKSSSGGATSAAAASAAAAAAAAFDPKMFGMDPKMMASLGIDPKAMASLASIDPKELAKLDPKMLASLDPSLAAMYASMSGLPGATHNGIATSKAASSPSGSGTTFKAKPGTVAAA